MVSYKDILASNALISESTSLQVAVFIGGTSGIGQFTIKALVATGTAVRIYLIGRKSSEARTRAFIQELSSINPKAEVIWIEGDVSLLSETKRICEHIKTKESYIDLLFLTAGYAPFGTRKETVEGIEIAQSLEYYSRILFIQHLLPSLNKSKAPRIVSVLGGGLEKMTVNLDDIDLKKPQNFGGVKAQSQYLAMNTVAMEKLAEDNGQVTFIHSWPGAVNTGNVRKSFDPNSIIGWVVWLLVEPVLSLISYNHEESGQRHLFQSTSAAFGGDGISWSGKSGVNTMGDATKGLFLVNHKCESTPNTKVVPLLRQQARDQIWSHTQDVLQAYM